MEINEALAKKVLDTVDAGLIHGMGKPVPGQMCVEAAVCYAMGLPHNDQPQCVGHAVRAFKIRLNDSHWSSDAARTKGLRRIAIAQLGSDQIDQKEFARLLAEETIKQIVPIALRVAASVCKTTKHAMTLEVAALRCEQEGTREAALEAETAASDVSDAYAACAACGACATCAACAACAAAACAACAAYAADVGGANYAACAADAAAEHNAKRDEILSLMASIGVDVLVKLGSKGCEWLRLAD